MSGDKDEEVKLTRDQGDLLKDNSTSTASDFLRAAAYTALKMPYDSAAQVTTNLTGQDLLPKTSFANKPEPAEFGSAKWTAQTLGTVTGAVPWLVAISKGVNGAAAPLAKNIGQETVSFMGLQMSKASFRTTELALAGGLYEGAIRPAENSNAMWTERGSNAFIGASTFAAYGWSLNKFEAAALNRSLENSILQNPYMTTISRGMQGAGAGVGAGFINAESTALLKEGRFATANELGKSMISYGLLAGGLNAALKPAAQANESSLRPAATESSQNGKAIPVEPSPVFSMTKALAESQRLRDLGKVNEAALKLEEGIQSLRATGPTRTTGESFTKLGDALRGLGEQFTPRARSAYEEAISSYKGQASYASAESTARLSALEEGAGNTAKAADLLEQSLRTKVELAKSDGLSKNQASEFSRSQSALYDKLERLFRKAGQFDKADALKASRANTESAPDGRLVRGND